MDDIANTGHAFSSVYDDYEALSSENQIDIFRRTYIREHIESFLKPGHKILELNAGSGIDAVYFAKKGHPILATDIAPASAIHIQNKIKTQGLNNLEYLSCSFTELEKLGDRKFDCIFSNFGGLNCTNDLQKAFKHFEDLLNPNGYVSLVVMPPFYPWEIATMLTGNKNALRRFRKDGTASNVGNETITTFYHTPNQIRKALGKNFRHIKTRNIGTFYPSAHFSSFQKNQSVIKKLMAFDVWFNNLPVMIKGIGDYYIITFQKKS